VAGDQHSDGAAGGGRTLADRLAAAGVSDRAEPWDAWLQLRAAEGNRATVIDLYELVASHAPTLRTWLVRTSSRHARHTGRSGARFGREAMEEAGPEYQRAGVGRSCRRLLACGVGHGAV